MTTRELVKIERGLNPGATLQQIAIRIGISRERVRQILFEADLPTRHKKPCKPHFVCNNCGRLFPRIGGRSRNLFCSFDCYKKYFQSNSTATLECNACGKLFSMRYSQLSARVKNGQQHFCCSHSCSGSIIGRNFGFRRHSENNLLPMIFP